MSLDSAQKNLQVLQKSLTERLLRQERDAAEYPSDIVRQLSNSEAEYTRLVLKGVELIQADLSEHQHRMKYILLRGLERGNKFFTMNVPGETEDEKCRLADGTLAYEIIGYAGTIREAQMKLYGYASTDQDD